MSKLICVECAPEASGRGGRNSVNPLSGLIGETLEKYLTKTHDQDKIPVRFPLSGPGSRVSLIHGDRVASDPYQVSLEGVLVKRSNLYVLPKRTPVSDYTRVPMCDPGTLFEKPIYTSTYSRRGFLSMMTNLRMVYPNSWVWKLEKKATDPSSDVKFKHIFIEARVYGIDSVISTYGANKLKGVAVEVIYRPQPTKEMLDKGIYVMRTCSDLYLLSDSEEYISYIDGVSVTRERMDYRTISNRVSGFITPKEATALNRFKALYAEVLEERSQISGSKVVEKKEKVKGNVPPSNKSRERFDGLMPNEESLADVYNKVYKNRKTGG